MTGPVSQTIRCGWRVSLALVLSLSLLGATELAATAGSPAARSTVRIYLVALGNGTVKPGTIGCGDTLIPVTVSIARTAAPLSAALRILLANHHQYYGQSGLYNTLYLSRLTLKRAEVENRHATINLSGIFRSNGVCDAPRIEGQLMHTITQFPSVRDASILVNGKPLRKLLSGR